MSYRIIQAGLSRSFPEAHPFLAHASADGDGDGVVYLGAQAGAAYRPDEQASFVAIELGTECLGVHTGEQRGNEGGNVVGFARYRLGDSAPTLLVELVRQPQTLPQALIAAHQAFADAGLVVAVCNDFPGRIVDRLLRPYLNSALRRLDERLASADDLDRTLCLGLGHPEGPITRLERTGLHHHYAVSRALYEALGQEAFAPARRAAVAAARAGA
ncbi:MAG: 3-hydroxyacyl-CoA dehydrogenase family protein [Burkholderiaceae bacterium]